MQYYTGKNVTDVIRMINYSFIIGNVWNINCEMVFLMYMPRFCLLIVRTFCYNMKLTDDLKWNINIPKNKNKKHSIGLNKINFVFTPPLRLLKVCFGSEANTHIPGLNKSIKTAVYFSCYLTRKTINLSF